MALRLGSVVVAGEILNLQRNSVHGWLALRGQDRPMLLQLTGNCEGKLAGKHFRFETRDDLPMQRQGEDDVDLSNLAWDQIGPTGTFTVQQVKVFEGSIEDFLIRSKLGEPPPTQFKPSLYLEWYSQNGRVVVEIADPILEFVDDIPAELSDAESAASSDPEAIAAAALEGVPWSDDPFEDELDSDLEDSDEGPEDPYGLFPQDLESQFEESAAETDRAVFSPDETGFITRIEAFESAMESGDGVPIREIFDPPVKVYRETDLDDEQIAVHFHTLLARLAGHGIALDMCEHFTPREAYRLLVEKILVEERTYPELAPVGYVQHYMTHDYCSICEAEIAADFEKFQSERKENGEGEEGSGSDDIPF